VTLDPNVDALATGVFDSPNGIAMFVAVAAGVGPKLVGCFPPNDMDVLGVMVFVLLPNLKEGVAAGVVLLAKGLADDGGSI